MNAVHWTIRGLARTFFRVYGRWELIGRDNIPKTGPVIVTPNHTSYVDPPLIGAAVPREGRYMARHDLWEVKGFPWLLPRLGVFPIHRDRPDRAAIRTALQALEQGLVMVMFPEGGRSADGTLQHGEPGVSLVVQKSGAPVVPCALIGPETMLPVGASKLKHTKIKVAFGPPLFFTPDSTREEIVRAIMHGIAELLTANGIPTVAKEDQDAAQQAERPVPDA